jgi:gliding motility-associated-like protein
VAAQEVVLRGSTHHYSVLPATRNANYTYSWSVSGGTSAVFNNDSASIAIIWDFPPGFYTLTMYPSDKLTGCTGNSKNIRVQVIDFYIRWKDASTIFCRAQGIGENDFSVVVEFRKTSSSWNFEYRIDDNTPVKVNINGEASMVINLSEFLNGLYRIPKTFKLQITGLTSPEGYHFVFDGSEPDAAGHICILTVNPLPEVNLGRDTSICYPDQLLLDAGNSGTFYEWSTGSRDQTIRASEGDGLIWVRVSNLHNCSVSDSIKILPCSPMNDLLIPNVFTPNDDGVNDVWTIGGNQLFPGMTVKLFDRWGRLIFASEPGYPEPWNGQRNGKLLPTDAYYYIIDLRNGTEPIRGSVTLVP